MANYYCTIRTNYFHVKDEEAFRTLIKETHCEDTMHIFEDKDKNGNKVFGFGTYGTIFGIPIDGEEEEDYSSFENNLQSLVADDDAIIIFEAGYEKLRYVVGVATIITSKNVNCILLANEAIAKARTMLNNQEWDTKCMY